jgi:hypothetical protein
MKYDTSWLLDQVTRFESIAASEVTFDDNDVIEFLETELVTTVTPICQSVNEEFGVFYEDIPVTASTLTLTVPSFATGQRLRSVNVVSGTSPNNQYLTSLPRLNPAQIASIILPPYGGFYLRNNEIVFYPSPINTGTIRLSYYRRPNELVSVASTGRIISINVAANTVLLDNAPPGVYWQAGDEMDILTSTLPFDFRVKGAILEIKSGTTLKFAPAVIAKVKIGDIVSLGGEACVAQFIPGEAHYLLAQLAAARCLQGLGDTAGTKIALEKAEQMKTNLVKIMSDRVQDQPKKIIGNAGIAGWSGPQNLYQGGR